MVHHRRHVRIELGKYRPLIGHDARESDLDVMGAGNKAIVGVGLRRNVNGVLVVSTGCVQLQGVCFLVWKLTK